MLTEECHYNDLTSIVGSPQVDANREPASVSLVRANAEVHIAIASGVCSIPGHLLWQVLWALRTGDVGVVSISAVQRDLFGGKLAMVRANLEVVIAEDYIELLAVGDILAGQDQAAVNSGGSQGSEESGGELHVERFKGGSNVENKSQRAVLELKKVVIDGAGALTLFKVMVLKVGIRLS